MANLPFVITNTKIKLVPDNDYYSSLIGIVKKCNYRLWISIFIVDLTPARDKQLSIDSALLEMRNAKWRGVDIRLLIGGSRINFEIAKLSVAARSRALSLRIPCRWLTSHKNRGSHVKMVIADDYVLTGSHNFSPGAITDQIQDSVLIDSAPLVAYLSEIFMYQWNRGVE